MPCGLCILFEVVLCKSVPLVHQCQQETQTPRHSREALSQRSQAQKNSSTETTSRSVTAA